MDSQYRVEIDLIDPLPVTDEELALIEIYLGPTIAEILDLNNPESEWPKALPRET